MYAESHQLMTSVLRLYEGLDQTYMIFLVANLP